MERSNAARTATLTPNHKEGSDLFRAQQHDSHAAGSLHVPQHPVAGLQVAFGNRAVQRMLSPHILRRKLTVGASVGIHEKEADAVTEQVTSSQTLRATAATGADDDHNPRNLTGRAANQNSAQRSLLRQIPIQTLQQTLGNRALARLFQPISPVPPVATLSRKCACGGNAKEECAECPANRLALQHSPVCEVAGQALAQNAAVARDVLGPGGGATGQAAVGDPGQPAGGAATPSGTSAGPTPTNGSTGTGLIVEDDVPNLSQGQMKKSDFLSKLKQPVSDAAQGALKGSALGAAGSVAIDPWFQQYAGQSAQQLERTIQSSVPGTGKVADAGSYIPLVAAKVGSAVSDWVKTGTVPPGVPSGLPGVLGTIGGAVSSAVQGAKNAISNIGGMLFKSKEGGASVTDDPRVIQAQLGGGEALEGSLQGRMSSAFGYDFSGVRVHKDNQAAQLSADLNARAFTIGRNVAFGAGEYQPGNPIGDALIAHELAHVVQQGGAATHAPLQKGAGETGSLEQDADVSAVRAVVSLWGGAKAGLANIGKDAIPALKSGLKLQRCKGKTAPPVNSCKDQDGLIQAGKQKAKDCVTNAINLTDGRPLTANASKDLISFFGPGSTDATNLTKINATFKKISSALDSCTYRCSKKGDPSDPDAICKGENAETSPSGNMDVTLCFDDPSKWSVPWAAWLMIHENFHRAVQFGHGWEAGSIDGCGKRIGFQPTQLDLVNPDSYACFAVVLCGEGASPEGGKELQRSATTSGGASSVSPVVNRALNSAGRPFDYAIRTLPGTAVEQELPERGTDPLAQRASQPQASSHRTDGEESLPGGAPTVLRNDFDPVLSGKATAPSQSANTTAAQTSVQRAVDSPVSVQRQSAPTPPASAATPVVAQTLSWSDFPPVPNRIGGYSHNTRVKRTWRTDGTGFNATFSRAGSWSVVADQTPELLRHEQYHLNLAVLMANKANAASGTMGASALLKAFETAVTTHDRSYEDDTEHGENTNLQAQWEHDIDAGVPEFPITPSAGK